MEPTIEVFTFRQGLLARLGHDLRLHVGRFEIEVQGGMLRAHCASDSLRLDGAIDRHGELDRDALDDGGRAQVEHATAEEVLDAKRFPGVEVRARIEGRGPDHFHLSGELTLHGQSRALSCDASRAGDVLQAEFELAPSDFGIRPFRALGGALKLQDRVRIVVRLPVEGLTGESGDPAMHVGRWTRTG